MSGAIEGLGSALILTNREQGLCVLRWYGDGSSKFVVVQESARAYPDNEPATVVLALANRACQLFR